MNPFDLPTSPLDKLFEDWNRIFPQPYDKRTVNPYTRTRVILMNGTEFESVWFTHQFSRACANDDLRRELALCRRVTQQRQKKLSMLKPIDEPILETTIGYEQLAVDLTARMAQDETDPNVKAALDFALLEDFDHLYRYANLLDMESGVHAEDLVGRYTEIMPARPTIAEHRDPRDSVGAPIDGKTANPLTRLHVGIITAAEQQTKNFYMNVGATYTSDLGRRLYQEIALIEEQHVSEYGSLTDPNVTQLESLLLHDYTACYLYFSCMNDEPDAAIRHIWEHGFEQSAAQLQASARLLEQYEGKQWQQVIPDGAFPPALSLGPNIEYVRSVIAGTVHNTRQVAGYADVRTLPADNRFFRYQQAVNPDAGDVPSHQTIRQYLASHDGDYRWETAPNPIEELRNRKVDNTTLGRK